MFIIKIIITIYLLISNNPVFADTCTVDPISGDSHCVNGSITYVFPSQATLTANANAQFIIDANNSKIQQKSSIQSQLDVIDSKTIRSIRSILVAQQNGLSPSSADVNTLKNLETQSQSLRQQLSQNQ